MPLVADADVKYLLPLLVWPLQSLTQLAVIGIGVLSMDNEC